MRGGRGRRARAGADDRASAALDGDGCVGAAGLVPSLANVPLRAARALCRRLLLGAPTRRQPLATKLTHHAPRAQASEGDLRDRASWAELRRGGGDPVPRHMLVTVCRSILAVRIVWLGLLVPGLVARQASAQCLYRMGRRGAVARALHRRFAASEALYP